jgi:glucose-1-phosphate thymidylyltransferase
MYEAGVTDAMVAGPQPALTKIAEALEVDEGSRPRIHYLAQSDGSTVGALRAAAPLFGDSPVLVQAADSLVWDGLDCLFDGDSVADALVLLRECSGATSSDGDGTSLLQLLLGQAGADEGVEPAGFYLLSPRAIRAVQSLQGSYDLAGIIEQIVEDGGRAEGRRVDGCWHYGGDPQRLLEANRILLEQLPLDVRPPAHLGSDLEGRVLIHPSAELSRATIRGPAAIGPHTRISDAYIGPYTSIGANAVVEGAEIENSIVLPGATIAYLGRRLEGSIVGAGAKLFRDFRLPRALRVRVGAGAHISLV